MGGSTLPLAPDAYSGRKLGKYEVLCRLSTGGMAEIFLASQRGLAGFRKLVVLKQILPDIAGEEEFVQMFLDEAKVTAAFNHPHIAQVFDLDVAEGELFLAMEFVEGATLVEVAKACRAVNEPIPIGFSLEAVRDTALALHYAHTFTDPLGRPSSIIHRDVAEKNVMVTYEGVTKLLDFGIAKSLARKGRTQVGMVKGTSGYMSPEQILGEPLDPRSDLFSLGVVLHECLTGLRLFHGKTPQAGAGAVLHGQIPPPSRVNKAIPPELDAIVLKALARPREDRYTTTLEFARAMERAVGPLIWHPEQSGELIRRHFFDRREQTRQLLMAERALSGESTGQVNVAKLFAPTTLPSAPALPPEPGTTPGLPQITPTLPPAPRASLMAMPVVKPPAPEAAQARPPTPRLSMAAMPVVSPPAAQPLPETQAKPPTPPRGAPMRRSSATGTRALPPSEPAPVRRPVFEPLPQKRTSTATGHEAIPPAPSAQENTDRTQPGDNIRDKRPPDGADGEGTRAALLEAHAPAEAKELPRSEPRTRPSRLDLHSMGTIPWTDAPPNLRGPPVPDEPLPDEEDAQEVKTSLVIRSIAPPPNPRTSNPGARAPRRREPTPPPVDEELTPADLQTEFTTQPVRAAMAPELGPSPDTNETLLPDDPDVEDGPTIVTMPGVRIAPQRKRQRSGLGVVVLAGVVLLLGGLGTVVALGLDGGRLMELVSPPPTSVEDLGRMQPIPRTGTPAPPAQPPPAPQVKPPPPEPAAAPASAAPAPPEPSTPGASAPATVPSDTPAEGTPPPPMVALAAAPEAEAPAPVTEAALNIPDADPPQPTKKTTRPPKRTRRDAAKTSSSVDIEAFPDDASSASATAGGGGLTLATDPYAKVYLGKRYLGDTPLFKISLPSGKHLLSLVVADGRTLRVPVEIKPGETTALKLALDELARE
ncbi:protein kinase domain-containing protein [Hyalangium sp.]|uniref:protein kinase domain-containing protein n=1 Tax=Hyalangium sp. TaxID=2028555 RepID=UPI002D2FD7E5|nr:protein kinase [Hyalangium sp.]HYH98172.1 protein kinase [Hyalangium sp.]